MSLLPNPTRTLPYPLSLTFIPEHSNDYWRQRARSSERDKKIMYTTLGGISALVLIYLLASFLPSPGPPRIVNVDRPDAVERHFVQCEKEVRASNSVFAKMLDSQNAAPPPPQTSDQGGFGGPRRRAPAVLEHRLGVLGVLPAGAQRGRAPPLPALAHHPAGHGRVGAGAARGARLERDGVPEHANTERRTARQTGPTQSAGLRLSRHR